MPLYDADGNVIEGALTPEEAEAKVAEAREAAKKEAADEFSEKQKELQGQLEQAKVNQTELQKKVDGMTDKDKNWNEMRGQLEKANEKVGELEERLNSSENARTESAKSSAIAKLADGDEEMRKKIELHYGRLAKGGLTEEQVIETVVEAFKLASDEPPNRDAIDAALARTGSGAAPRTGGVAKSPLSPEARDMAKRHFGITDADIEKFSKKG